jgi:hypothetical protein
VGAFPAPQSSIGVRLVSIDEQGFLSCNMNLWISKHRTENAVWFAHAEKLNRLGQRAVINVIGETEDGRGLADHKLVSMLLFVRALSNFQGTMLMAERGMVIEARTLLRTCVESTLCLGALKNDPAFLTTLLHDELRSRKARANFLLKEPGRLAFCDGDAAARLREYVESIDTWGKLSSNPIEQMAEKAGWVDLYLFYRQLSGDAAHPSITALDRYVLSDESREKAEIRWGPNCPSPDISDTLNLACHVFIGACACITELFLNADRDIELRESLTNTKS